MPRISLGRVDRFGVCQPDVRIGATIQRMHSPRTRLCDESPGGGDGQWH